MKLRLIGLALSLILVAGNSSLVHALEKKELPFDFEVIPFQKTQAGKSYFAKYKTPPKVRDKDGYPRRETVFKKLKIRQWMKSKRMKDSSSMNLRMKSLMMEEAFAMDNGSVPGEVNCRANTSVTTGYFKAYFEDVALGNNHGYADPTFGLARRAAACQVLEEIATLVNLSDAGVIPDILFTANLPPNSPSGALASASTYYGVVQSSSGLDNGTLHYHITAREDPTPGIDEYDAVINTNWNILSGSYKWSVDLPLIPTWNPSYSFDFITVMRHEVFHALGFAGAMSDSVITTGVEVFHNTFNENSFASLGANRYFNLTFPLTPKIQAPVGAPSSWFINNTGIYQGTNNTPGAGPSGARALYNPLSWQQGSSLSHFDKNRAPTPAGTIYVMHPSIGPNEVRTIHAHELEVLCHLGYQVENLCDVSTPFAKDDMINLTSATQCIPLLNNDHSFTSTSNSNANLVVYDAQSIQQPSGTTLTYFSASNDCGVTGGNATTPNFYGAKSIQINNNTNLYPLSFKYRVLDTVSNRISQAAMVYLSNCNSSLNEYVCNGDFEQGVMPGGFNLGIPGNALFYYYKVPYWGVGYSSPDFVFKNHPGVSPSSCNLPYAAYPALGPAQQTLVNMINNQGSYAGSFMDWASYDNEMLAAKLKIPLTVGQAYKFSFDVTVVGRNGINDGYLTTPRTIIGGLHTQNMDYYNWNNIGLLPGLTSDIIISEAVPVSYKISNAVWTHLERTFVAQSAYEYMILYSLHEAGGPIPIIIDNVSIQKVTPENSISGVVYNDLNQNGSWGAGEMELTNRTVGLYSNANPPVLIQTANTSVIPPYRYTFPLGSTYLSNYLIALMPETNYSVITEPATNSSTLISGKQHVKQVSFSGGQVTNHNFGVFLSGQAIPFQATATSTLHGCGELNGSITLSVSGGVGPYTYSWSGPSGFTSSNANIYSLAAGNYTVVVTDSTGATTTTSANVPASQFFTVTGTVTQASGLTGASIVLSVTGQGPFTYSWSNGQTSSAIAGLVPGVYTVNVTNAQGCTVIQSFVIHQPSSESFNGECCRVKANANPLVDCSDPIMNFGNTSGMYYAQQRCNAYNQGNSCEWNISNPKCCYPGYPGCSTTPGLLCSPPSVSIPYPFGSLLTNASPQYEQLYEYCKKLSANSPNPEQYSCCVTLPEYKEIVLSAVAKMGCTKESGFIDLTVSGGVIPYTYSWTGPNGYTATTQDLTGIPGGVYTVVVTDAAGTSSAPYPVTVPFFQPIVINGTVSHASPFAYNNGAINITVTPTSSYAYQWTKSGSTTFSSTLEDLTGLTPGVYTVTVKNKKMCQKSRSFTVLKKMKIYNDTLKEVPLDSKTK